MRTLRLPGFWYCDATPAGAYVAAHYLDARVQAGHSPDEQRALTAPDAVLQIRISPDGTRYAGGAHDLLNIVALFDGAAWQQISAPVTPSCAIFTNGSLVVADPAVTGSQGYRYIDDSGQPVPAFRTYAPGDPASDLLHAAGITDVWEATIHGDVVVGQGNTSAGCVIRHGGKRYLLEPGDTTFVRFARVGSSLSIALMKTLVADRQYEAVFYWLDVSEIASLPESYESAPAPQPAPIPSPAPAPTPVPVPEPSPVSPLYPPIPNMLALVQEVCSEHPDLIAAMQAIAIPDNKSGVWPDADQAKHGQLCGQLIEFIASRLAAADPNWGLEKKPSGAQYNGHALKEMLYRSNMAMVQVLNDYGGEWAPQDMSDPDNARTPDFWLAAAPVPSPAPVPAPAPAPVPPTPAPAPGPVGPAEPDLAAILAAVQANAAAIAATKADVDAAHQEIAAFVTQVKTYLPEILAVLGASGSGSASASSLIAALSGLFGKKS